MHTTGISNNINIDDQGARALQFKFLPTNLNVQLYKPEEIHCFCSERFNLRPSCKVFMQQ